MGRNIQTLTSYLKDLMKIISYLTVMQHIDMERSLGQFMSNVLELEKSPAYLKGDIQLRHVRDVWLLLKYTQTDTLLRNEQVCLPTCIQKDWNWWQLFC